MSSWLAWTGLAFPSQSSSSHRPPGVAGVSATAALFLVLGIWVVIGVLTAFAMGRRGHRPLTWVALGVCFGPLVIPLAISSLREHQENTVETVLRGRAGAGSLDILVGVDGSDEAMTATRRAIELFGSSTRRFTLAAVLDYDTAQSSLEWDERSDALRNLERHAQAVADGCDVRPDTVLLTGRPADALQAHARNNDYDVLVIGRRGRGATKALLGSVAAQVSRDANMPVLLIGE